MWILKILHLNSLKSKPSLQINYKYLLLYHGAQHLEGQNGQRWQVDLSWKLSDHDSVTPALGLRIFSISRPGFGNFAPVIGPISVFFLWPLSVVVFLRRQGWLSQVAYKSPMSLNGFTASTLKAWGVATQPMKRPIFRNVQGALGWHSHWILVVL